MLKTTTTRDKGLYDLTYRIADTSQCHYKMGAIIVKGNRVLSVGVNQIKTHPAIAKTYDDYCVSIHAELAALLRNKTDVTGATMYVARNGGKVSKPCKSCMVYIRMAGIKYIVYSTYEGLRKQHVD